MGNTRYSCVFMGLNCLLFLLAILWVMPAFSAGLREEYRLRVVSPLQFGTIISPHEGSSHVWVYPENSMKRVSGGAYDAGGLHSPALFEIRGMPGMQFIITLPRSVESGNGRTRIEELKSWPERTIRLGPDGMGEIAVGGKLLMPSGSSGEHGFSFSINLERIEE